MILLNIELSDELKLENYECEIVREIEGAGPGSRIYGVKFMNVDPLMEKEFVKFVFRQEIESNKKNRR